MQVARKGWSTEGADARDIILRPQGVTAFDIYLVRYGYTAFAAPFDAIETDIQALSVRLEDQVDEGVLALSTLELFQSDGVFALSAFTAGLTTSGQYAAVLTDTIPYPRPYRVPFAAWLLKASSSVATAGWCEVYYEEVKVNSREMVWLRRRTDRPRTT